LNLKVESQASHGGRRRLPWSSSCYSTAAATLLPTLLRSGRRQALLGCGTAAPAAITQERCRGRILLRSFAASRSLRFSFLVAVTDDVTTNVGIRVRRNPAPVSINAQNTTDVDSYKGNIATRISQTSKGKGEKKNRH